MKRNRHLEPERKLERGKLMEKNKIRNRAVIVVALLAIAYVAQVVYFEARLGYNQPENQSTIVVATFDEEQNRHERVVRLVEINGSAYVAANHWPRAWYRQALENPRIEVKMDNEFEPYIAVPLEGAEEERIRAVYTVNLEFRFRTGFPPRYFLRLDPA
jgi:hypothetical protein